MIKNSQSLCEDCGKVVNVEREDVVVEGKTGIFTRYKCKRCGVTVEKSVLKNFK